jgi:predicted transcriptional regulator
MTKISAVVPDELADALEERARAEDRSASAVIRRALAEHVLPGVPVEYRTAEAAVEPGLRRDSEEAR